MRALAIATAEFEPLTDLLLPDPAREATLGGTASVSPSPTPTCDGSWCAYEFVAGTEVTITATSSFTFWDNGQPTSTCEDSSIGPFMILSTLICAGQGNPCTVEIGTCPSCTDSYEGTFSSTASPMFQ